MKETHDEISRLNFFTQTPSTKARKVLKKEFFPRCSLPSTLKRRFQSPKRKGSTRNIFPRVGDENRTFRQGRRHLLLFTRFW